ncbi:MAG: class I SAM-dependent DNA methyltransferase [Acidimicrobiales bacterium]
MADKDRLDWIFDSDRAGLEARYDQWASSYDDDHDEWGWRGPELVVEAVLRLGEFSADQAIYDAGCGTGRVGLCLRRAGWTGRTVGLDFSQGMLDVAAEAGDYDELIKCSLLDIPLPEDSAAAIVSSGVFTHGHVGGEAFAELARITRPAGLVSVTQRLDVEEQLSGHASALSASGRWQLVERTTPESLHPERDEALQTITTWRVR